MTKRGALKLVLIALASFAALCPLMAQASDVRGRTCLDGLVDQYIAAMVAHDPGRLPLARHVKFTENGVHLLSPANRGAGRLPE